MAPQQLTAAAGSGAGSVSPENETGGGRSLRATLTAARGAPGSVLPSPPVLLLLLLQLLPAAVGPCQCQRDPAAAAAGRSAGSRRQAERDARRRTYGTRQGEDRAWGARSTSGKSSSSVVGFFFLLMERQQRSREEVPRAIGAHRRAPGAGTVTPGCAKHQPLAAVSLCEGSG